jgi:hypothetical protein
MRLHVERIFADLKFYSAKFNYKTIGGIGQCYNTKTTQYGSMRLWIFEIDLTDRCAH